MDTTGLGLTHTLQAVRHKGRGGAKVLQIPRSAEDRGKVGVLEAAWNDKVKDRLFASLVPNPPTPRCLGHYTCFLVQSVCGRRYPSAEV